MKKIAIPIAYLASSRLFQATIGGKRATSKTCSFIRGGYILLSALMALISPGECAFGDEGVPKNIHKVIMRVQGNQVFEPMLSDAQNRTAGHVSIYPDAPACAYNIGYDASQKRLFFVSYAGPTTLSEGYASVFKSGAQVINHLGPLIVTLSENFDAGVFLPPHQFEVRDLIRPTL